MPEPPASSDPPHGAASLRPVSGSVREIERLVTDWLGDGGTEPVVVRSSGSTGTPKDVALSAGALLSSAGATLSRLGGPGSWVLALPAHYVAGIQVLVRSWLARTSPVVLADHRDLATATRALPAGRRYLAAAPTQLYRWMTARADVGALRLYDAVLIGGGAAAPALLDSARESGVEVVTTYGMSETAGGCVYDGVPLDGVRVAVGADGCIRVAGPVLFDGYVGDPELTARVLRDGWLLTSDVGRLDADGRLEVLGRADDMVVSGGVNVSVGAVERRLASMDAVGQCAVAAVPDREWGSRLVAHVVTAAGATPPTLAEIRDFVAAAHPRSWAPRSLVVHDRLPMLESGKIDRRALPPAGGLEPSP